MRMQHTVVEYTLEEAAEMLDIPPRTLRAAVKAGYLHYYYLPADSDYRFHEASLRANKDLLAQEEYRAEVLKADTTTEPDAPEADPPSTPSDP